MDYNSPWAEYNPQTRKRALSSRVGQAIASVDANLFCAALCFGGRVWDAIGVDYVWLAGYVDCFCCVVVFLLGVMGDD